MYDRDAFRSTLTQVLGERPEVKAASVADQLRRLKDFSIKAAVAAEDLTGKPEWDTFLAWVEERRYKLAEERFALVDALTDRSRADPNSLIAIKLDLAHVEGQLEALEWAASLPKQAIENGKVAEAVS